MLTQEQLVALLPLAAEYQLWPLVRQLQYWLCKFVRVDNCLLMLATAAALSASHLVTFCAEYAVSNKREV